MRYSHFGILCFGALLREAQLSSFSLEDLGFEFETSASTADDDLWSDDLAREIVGQNLRASAASASTGLPNLVKKGKTTKVVASRGSADGSKPKIRLSSAVDPEVPFLDISRNAVIEIPQVGRLTIKGVLYDDAEDSQILRAISEDDTPYAVKIQYRTRFKYADMDTEVDTLRHLAGAGAHIVSLVYASGSEFRNAKGKKFKYCVLEMLGESVSELNNRVSVIPEATIFDIARQGIEALRRVHDTGYVHGDVGPGNLVFKGNSLS